jgi:hypothetical protein
MVIVPRTAAALVLTLAAPDQAMADEIVRAQK